MRTARRSSLHSGAVGGGTWIYPTPWIPYSPRYLPPDTQGSHSDWKTWKNGKAFSSQGKVREFWWDWKSQGKSHKILENWGNFRQMLFVIFQWQLNEFVCFLLNLIKFSVKKTITEKILENGEKYWKSQGILSVRKSGNPDTLCPGYPTAPGYPTLPDTLPSGHPTPPIPCPTPDTLPLLGKEMRPEIP